MALILHIYQVLMVSEHKITRVYDRDILLVLLNSVEFCTVPDSREDGYYKVLR